MEREKKRQNINKYTSLLKSGKKKKSYTNAKFNEYIHI